MGLKVLMVTNVWIPYFRDERVKVQERPVAEMLDRLIGEDRGVLCGVVEAELYGGSRKDERSTLEAHLGALDLLETERENLCLKRRGVTVFSFTALVAALCLRDRLALLENDGHFEHIENLKRVPWRAS